MSYKCKLCPGHGVYKIKRRWWQRLLRKPHVYRCIDCDALSTKAALEK